MRLSIRTRVCFFLLLCCSAWLPVAAAWAAPRLITAGPSWSGFTERDGSGLYHELIRAIYAADYQVEHQYLPSNQSNELVAAGQADIRLCETEVEAPLRLGRYPMYENEFFALFLRDPKRPWRGAESLRTGRLVWREGYYSQADFSVPVSAQTVRSGEAALMLIKLGRADFYIDDLALIRQSFRDAAELFDRQRYAVEPVGRRRYYPVFADNARGRRLQREYEQGMRRLAASGQLQTIFQRYGFPVPEPLRALAAGQEGAE